ncbi:MAG TPA: radical SAM protein [Candidatus Paceibacterota bacterium]|nr:radical SAM protein [Candidatus Paceibacterota bacterium]
MSKILLYDPLDEFLIGNKEFAPLGILYISSWLKKRGYEVDVIHGKPEEIIVGDYDLYGISATTPQYLAAVEAAQNILKENPNAKIVLGGAHTNAPQVREQAFSDGFTQIVVGEGEKAMEQILKNNPKKGSTIFGERLTKNELGDLLPDRDALNISEYGYPLGGSSALTMMTARGCPYKCQFCSSGGTKYSFRPINNIIEEVDLLVNKYGVNRILFIDDVFTLNHKRLRDLSTELKAYIPESMGGLRWRCYSRTDMELKGLEIMADGGCIEVGVGVESGSPDVLELVMKKTNPESNVEFIKATKQVGIKANTFMMIGLPGESPKTIKETRNWIKKAMPEVFGYNIYTPMPDSPILQKCNLPIQSGKFKGKKMSDFITLYDMPFEKSVMKAKKIEECFVSTPWLSRQDIIDNYHKEFEEFVEITGFDPRTRGDRRKVEYGGIEKK